MEINRFGHLIIFALFVYLKASFRLVARAACLAGELARRIRAATTASKLAGYTGNVTPFRPML
jgi:hypothetical protein